MNVAKLKDANFDYYKKTAVEYYEINIREITNLTTQKALQNAGPCSARMVKYSQVALS